MLQQHIFYHILPLAESRILHLHKCLQSISYVLNLICGRKPNQRRKEDDLCDDSMSQKQQHVQCPNTVYFQCTWTQPYDELIETNEQRQTRLILSQPKKIVM